MDYKIYQIKKEKEFEDVCLRCGNCCGVNEDACIHLIQLSKDKYTCDIYDSRGGMQKTQEGKFFECVSIRTILNEDWPGHWNCAYIKQRMKTQNDLEYRSV